MSRDLALCAAQLGAIDALRRHVAADGELPTLKQLTEDLPTAWTIRQLFGSWNGHLETAGFTPRPYQVSNRAGAVSAIQRWAEHHDGRPPSRAEWLRPSDRHPSEGQARRLFGTWSAAIEPAGFCPQKGKQARWSEEAILDALRRWGENHGVPSASDWITPAVGRPTRTSSRTGLAPGQPRSPRPDFTSPPANDGRPRRSSTPCDPGLKPIGGLSARWTGNARGRTIRTASTSGSASDHGMQHSAQPD